MKRKNKVDPKRVAQVRSLLEVINLAFGDDAPPPFQVPTADVLAMDIQTAAKAVGLSRAQFYRLYLQSGRVRAIKTGGRDRVIDYAELQAAYAKLRDELPRAKLRK